MPPPNKFKRVDGESLQIIHKGANLSELSSIFGMDHRILVEKLIDVLPTGERNGAATYLIRDVAPYLVKPNYEIEAYIKRMNHADLPKHLTKEFWAGLRSKQEYELKNGDLWPTSRVVESVGKFMKLVKMSVRLMSDQVNRQAELTERQRLLVRGIGDALLEELHRSVVDAFSEKPTNDEVLDAVEEQLKEDDDEL